MLKTNLSADDDTMSAAVDLAERATSRDPNEGLQGVAALGRLLERLEVAQVTAARRAGWSWQRIADAVGVSKQTVHRKHHRLG
jgi:transcriptional regulator of acetoin/glycerol metabolism